MDLFRRLALVGTLLVCLPTFPRSRCLAEDVELQVPSLEQLLPADGTEVDVMGAPPRLSELGDKLQSAMKEDPVRFFANLGQAQPGELLGPYDPSFGITQEEYEEFNRLVKTGTFVKVSTATLEVTQTDKIVRLDGGEELPELKGMEFDLERKSVKTPFGKLTDAKVVLAVDEQTATGRWNGFYWKTQTVLPPAEVTVMLGKLEGSGRGLFAYRARGLDKLSLKEVACVLNFDLPPAK